MDGVLKLVQDDGKRGMDSSLRWNDNMVSSTRIWKPGNARTLLLRYGFRLKRSFQECLMSDYVALTTVPSSLQKEPDLALLGMTKRAV